ncbi:MAG: HAMP domain-containing sensor histidine kinase [Saprospiraceae bacterium]|nr:HAMP domain-containing sensor histidine kinase [Saprospiraceae bacterium]
MKNKHIILLALFGAVAILAIVVVQVFWVKEALHISDQQFDQTVQIALREVAEKIAKKNKTTYEYKNPVKKINSTHYIVLVNSEIDSKLLDYYIPSTFEYFNIKQDVEYAIYSCFSKEMVYCNYIQKNKSLGNSNLVHHPKFEGLDYYFSVSFPHYSIVSMHNVPMWVVTSIILMLAVFFFIYALFVVFRQRSITQVQKDFINNMTHEFKTPISTISIIQQVISDPEITKTPERLLSYSNIIGAETKRLNEQVEKVLNIAKIEKGQFQLKKEKLHVHEIIDAIEQQFVHTLKQSGEGSLIVSLDAVHDLVLADKVHLTNILFNLTDNAIKYGGHPPELHITTRNEGDKIIISIQDNGDGIEKKNLGKIFDKFYRIPTGKVHNVKGFGLGLFYVKKIVDAHKWKIVVTSVPGKGTQFSILMPLKIS